MPTRTELLQSILRDYERVRNQKAAELRERKEKIYAAAPRIREIEQEMSLTGVRVAAMTLRNPEESVQMAENLQRRLKKLKEEKMEILEEKGFSPKEMELQYICPQCRDTGFVGTEKCVCMKRKLMDAAYEQSNVRDIAARENFDAFDIRYYSDTIDPKENMSPRQNIQNIMRDCLRFTQEFDREFSNLFLYGSTGLGKTFLCNCVAKELLDRGKIVLYVTAGQLFTLIENQRFGRTEEETPDHYMEDILEADLFIIDDLGTEFSTILSSAELFRIINTRMLNRKPVVLSTNLAPADLINQYSDRIVSRLLGDYKVLKFFGGDIRIMKKYAKDA